MIRELEHIDELRELGIIGPLDQHFARTLGRIAGEHDERVLLAVAMASRHVQSGHVCLDLERLAAAPLRVERVERDEDSLEVRFPSARVLRAALAASALCGGREASTPLHLDDAGRLYLRRYHDYEERLAAALWRRIPRPPPSAARPASTDDELADVDDRVDEALLNAGLDRLFGKEPGRPQLGLFDEPDLQRLAARRAVERSFAVISGGPGTGKTSTVVKILALLIEQRLAAGDKAPRIALLAPTGKAAARLSESIKQAKAKLDCSEQVRAAIEEEGRTIHRALGTFAGRVNRFRHDAEHPLQCDLVVVDEASMVDLALMHRLLDAVPREARVILLGDKNQLSSVEAGAVLGDICGAGLPAGAHAPIAGAIVHLTRSYRYAADSGIRRLADAVNAADADAAIAVLQDSAVPDVSLVEPAAAGERGLPAQLLAGAVDGMRALFEADDPRERLAALEHYRVLCAHRRGRRGLVAVNEAIELELRRRGIAPPEGERYAGRPVLVTQNDYQARLFNGDVGILTQDPRESPDDPPSYRASFLGLSGELYSLSAARLPPHESVYAMSVHKSQGSEFDHVSVLLPEEPSPVLSRELLYTAVTRARKRVEIYGSAAMVRHAVMTAVERASGLRDRLWHAARNSETTETTPTRPPAGRNAD